MVAGSVVVVVVVVVVLGSVVVVDVVVDGSEYCAMAGRAINTSAAAMARTTRFIPRLLPKLS